MKLIKKIMVVFTAILLVMSMTNRVYAEDNGSITIQNTVKGKEYKVFKVFDATYVDGTNPLKVSYTYTPKGETDAFLAALQDETSPFTLSRNGEGPYYVTLKTDKVSSDIVTFLNAQKTNLGNAVATLTGDGKTQKVSNLAYGYYYITTTTGSEVTIDSALKDVVVIDKNETIPKPDKKETVDGPTVTERSWVEDVTQSIGKPVYYRVTGSFTRYVGETLVTSIDFTDVMTEGLTLNKDVAIKVTSANGVEKTLTVSTDYTVNYNDTDRTTTIHIPTATVDTSTNAVTFLYDTGSTYEITYSATVNEKSIKDGKENNTVTMYYNNDQLIDKDTTTVDNYKITLNKVDSNDATKKLAGAEFKLYDAKTGGNNISVVLIPFATAYPDATDTETVAKYGTKDCLATYNNQYRVAQAGETGVAMVTGLSGVIEVKGLAFGNYYFEETKAPEGYNPLPARTDAVEIKNNEGEPYQNNVTINVQNTSGVELPSTGGIGTTIFHVLGGALVLGAGIILIAKKRVNS